MPILSALMPFLPYLIGGIAIVTVIGVHDFRVRSAEAAKWKPKLETCEGNVKTATDANLSLKKDFDQFIDAHNKYLKKLADDQKIALTKKNELLAALRIKEQAAQAVIEQLLVDAAAGPQVSKEVACAKAESTLRALATDLMRDDAAHK